MGNRKFNLEDKILNTIKEYNLLKKDDSVLVAVSGGPDSMCLLNSLINLKEKLKIKEIKVAHVNHMLREEAETETKYVEDFCKSKNIKIFIKYVNIKEIKVKNKISEELAGREERYKFFDEIAKKEKIDKIAIAHNYNDNAETVLMHLLRGTGMSGLSGISPNTEGKYIRPIIKCTRKEIENYCSVQNLQPKFDKTNKDNKYNRNKIRNSLIPYIEKEFNPNIIETLNRLSEVIANDNKFIEDLVVKEYSNICEKEDKNKIIIDLKKFNDENNALKSRLILHIVKKLFGNTKNIEKVHLDDIIKLCNNNIGNKYLMPNKNLKVYIKSGEVTFTKTIAIN